MQKVYLGITLQKDLKGNETKKKIDEYNSKRYTHK